METGYRSRRANLRHLILWTVCLLLVFGAGTTQAQWGDYAQFFFDTNYSNQYGLVDTFPGVVPVYLVLNQPTRTAIAGWEGRISIEGPGSLLWWNLEGSTMNLAAPPQFIVGINEPFLPGLPQVLLGTFGIQIDEDLPVTLTLVPLDFPSVPENIAYLAGDGSEDLVPMNDNLWPPTGIINCAPNCGPLAEYYIVPELALGLSDTMLVTVFNNTWDTCGPANMDVRLSDSCPDFHLTEISGPTVVPYRALQIPVVYTPLSTGFHSCLLDLGDECSSVLVQGICRDPIVGDDHLAVFFDAYATYETQAEAGATVTAYVVLLHPSIDTNLVGWEACVSLAGDAEITSSYLTAEGVNELDAPCFKVTNGPVSYRNDMITLASFDILVHSDEEEVAILLTPIPDATLPGQLSFTMSTATEPAVLPLATYLEGPAVAWINPQPVGVTANTPSAHATGSQVTLSWAVPTGDYDGCRVYRRAGNGVAESLNARLLPVSGTSFTYIDDAADVIAGSALYYSYGLIKDGVEIARSAEVEVQLKSLPAAVTQLLPSVPNPFNPKTEIRFELSIDGPAKVTIHDVAGRLVYTLVDESLAAGPYSRTWYGVDDQGRRAPSGAYYIRLETDGTLDHGKVMLLK
jgi:FlgD Ig-like domain